MLFIIFAGGWRYGEVQGGRKDQLNPREGGRGDCITDANEGDLGLVRKKGKGKEGKRKRR